MSGQNARLSWVDTAKGISIILVVMMYSVFNVGQDAEGVGLFHYVIGFATPFRMPEFFLISGLFLDQVLSRTWKAYADRRVLHYFYFYAVWAVIHIVLKIGIMSAAPLEAATDLLWATEGDQVRLAWTAPDITTGFIGVAVVRQTGRVPTSNEDGTLIYMGPSSVTNEALSHLSTSEPTYYAVFNCNTCGKCGTEAPNVEVTPGTGPSLDVHDFDAGLSADGKSVYVLANRGPKAKTQVWRVPVGGGEPVAVTKAQNGVTGYDYAPVADAVFYSIDATTTDTDEFSALRQCLIDALMVVDAETSEHAIVERSVQEALESCIAMSRRLVNPELPLPRVAFGGLVVELIECQPRPRLVEHQTAATVH